MNIYVIYVSIYMFIFKCITFVETFLVKLEDTFMFPVYTTYSHEILQEKSKMSALPEYAELIFWACCCYDGTTVITLVVYMKCLC